MFFYQLIVSQCILYQIILSIGVALRGTYRLGSRSTIFADIRRGIEFIN